MVCVAGKPVDRSMDNDVPTSTRGARIEAASLPEVHHQGAPRKQLHTLTNRQCQTHSNLVRRIRGHDSRREREEEHQCLQNGC